MLEEALAAFAEAVSADESVSESVRRAARELARAASESAASWQQLGDDTRDSANR